MATFTAKQVEKYNYTHTIDGYGEFSYDCGWRFEVYQDDVYYRDFVITAKKVTAPGGMKTLEEVEAELQALLIGEALQNGDDAPAAVFDVPDQSYTEGT